MSEIILHPNELEIFKNLVTNEGINRKIIEVSTLTDDELSEWFSSRPELQIEDINEDTMKRIIRPIKVRYTDTVVE